MLPSTLHGSRDALLSLHNTLARFCPYQTTVRNSQCMDRVLKSSHPSFLWRGYELLGHEYCKYICRLWMSPFQVISIAGAPREKLPLECTVKYCRCGGSLGRSSGNDLLPCSSSQPHHKFHSCFQQRALFYSFWKDLESVHMHVCIRGPPMNVEQTSLQLSHHRWLQSQISVQNR